LAGVPNGPVPTAEQWWNGSVPPARSNSGHSDEPAADFPHQLVIGLSGASLRTAWRLIDRIFDFRFKRYLTPYLIRAWWAWLVFCCFAGYFIYCFAVPIAEHISKRLNEQRAVRVASEAGQERDQEIDKHVEVREDGKRINVRRTAPVASRARNAQPVPTNASQPDGNGAAFGMWLLRSIGYVFACGCFLICARILAELIIVIFNISSDLREAKRRFEEIHAAA
jgi:hypothetical protein